MKDIIAAILILGILGGITAPAAEVDFNAGTGAAAVALQHWYNKDGRWDTTDWWNAANCVEAVENVIIANNGQSYSEVLRKTFRLNRRANFLNDYYDDEGWWALAWIRAYDLSGGIRYLKMAKTIFKDMTGGWNDHCDGGLQWRKSQVYKNAIPNELFLLIAIRLHQRTPGDVGAGSYFDWAIREWNWFRKTGMINGQNLVNDGLDRRCENNGRTTWTYNQGVIIGGLAELYKTTGDTNYLNQARAIADAAIVTLVDGHGVLQEPCETGDCAGGDTPQFKGIFIRYLALLYDVTRKPEYFDFLHKNARSVWLNDRNNLDQLGLRWSGPFDVADAARHSSAMMAVSALAEPMTKNLPFAKGAGNPAFHHAVGAASGTLAWTYDPTNIPAAGELLSGTTSVAAGVHTIHFRLGVNVLSGLTNGLVRLEVADSSGSNILAGREVAWNSFTATSEPQDFGLRFTNETADSSLVFRVYWNQVPAAPVLTLTDVTMDGSHNWTAANLGHEVGRLDGLNGWEADSIRDRASGYLVTGPGTRELIAGSHTVQFELKVDNFNLDESKVATISVADAATGQVIASQDVLRSQFPNVLYQTFELNFKSVAGKRYDFRTYWYASTSVPRLTQRSVVVQP